MSYKELAEHLRSLGSEVVDYHGHLEGISLAKAAESLEKAAMRFEKRLDDFLGGRVRALKNWKSCSSLPRPKPTCPWPG